MDGRTPTALARGMLCCHCLLLETAEGLTLVDTGYGLADVHNPKSRLSGFFLSLMSPELREDMTAARQIERLGFARTDVRHIVLTHLDFDHAGGLDDFPLARVHLLQQERDAAALQKTWLDRQRFRPAQWSSRPRWQVYAANEGDTWYGFQCVRALRGVSEDVLLVPLPGHTLGHAGIAIRSGNRWLLQAGDAYFHWREMDFNRPWCTPGLRMYQTMMEKDRYARLRNQDRLRTLKREHGGELTIICAHDNTEFENLANRAIGTPVLGHVAVAMP
jgi:glyoxylase-like metal-dependent hydrolase (beta-lactamase superfamily II)